MKDDHRMMERRYAYNEERLRDSHRRRRLDRAVRGELALLDDGHAGDAARADIERRRGG